MSYATVGVGADAIVVIGEVVVGVVEPGAAEIVESGWRLWAWSGKLDERQKTSWPEPEEREQR